MAAASHPIRLELSDDLRRSRLTVFFRLLLALPHLVWVTGWGVAAQLAAFANWLAVLINGESPPVFHNFLAAYVRYATHVNAYVFLAANPFPGFRGRPGYPVDVAIAPPARQSRWSALFRLLLVFPAGVLASYIGSIGWNAGIILLVAFGVWFAAIVLGRSPRGLRDLSVYGLVYGAQALAYLLLVTGRYPDSHPGRLLGELSVPYHPVRLWLEDDLRRSRLTVFFRLLLAFPHLFWLFAWGVLAYLTAIVNWFAVLAIGRSPGPLHRFLAAYVRYTSQVYAFLSLVANPFPGFTGRAGYPVAIVIDGPARQRRLVTLFRLLLALPALALWSVLSYLLVAVGVAGWVVSLLLGHMPSGLRALGAATIRYGAQVTAFLFVVTDRYPNSSPALRTEPALPDA